MTHLPQWDIRTPAGRSVKQQIVECIRWRELLWELALNDVKLLSKQSFLGYLWVVIQPLANSLLFLVVFNKLIGVESDGVPYFLYVLSGTIIWSYQSQSVGAAVASIIGRGEIVLKIYFPRVLLPLSKQVTALANATIGFVVLLVLLLWYRIYPTWNFALLPFLLLWMMACSFGISLVYASLNVYFRDMGRTVGFFLQAWMYLSPVVYTTSKIPEFWKPLYYLNPLVGLLDSFRWMLFGSSISGLTLLSLLSTIGLIMFSMVVFARFEKNLADHI